MDAGFESWPRIAAKLSGRQIAVAPAASLSGPVPEHRQARALRDMRVEGGMPQEGGERPGDFIYIGPCHEMRHL
jgi:hypothetical protein